MTLEVAGTGYLRGNQMRSGTRTASSQMAGPRRKLPVGEPAGRVGERGSVSAGEHDERVAFTPGAPDGLEHAANLAIGLVEDVEISIECVVVDHRVTRKRQHRDAR